MISPHFRRKEFLCRCSDCGFNTVDVELLRYLELIRTHFEAPVKVNSGCRCVEYNASIGGATRSQHTKGRAADIIVSGFSPSVVADFAESIKVPGIGRYDTFTHVDSRNGVARWGMI